MATDRETPKDRDDRPRIPIAARLKSEPWLLLAFILIVAAAVRFTGIWQQSFSSDEIAELRVAHAGFTEMLTFGDGVPPLYNLLVQIVVPLGDLAGRVLAALFGVATIAITWAWARRIAGTRVAFVAAAMLALSPLAVQLSGEGRAYGLMAMLVAASLWSLTVALDEPTPGRWARWALISALGIYTHYLFGVLVVAWLIVALVEARGRPTRAMWIGAGTLAVLAAPAIALLLGDFIGQAAHEAQGLIRPMEVMYSGYRVIAGLSLGPSLRDLVSFGTAEAIGALWVWLLVLLPPIALLSVHGYRALGGVARRRLLAWSAVGLLAELVAIQAFRMGFGPSYVTWLVVPLAVLLAAGLVRLGPVWRRASTAVLLAVAVLSLVMTHLHPHHQVDDARGVAAYLESSGALDHPIFVSFAARIRPIVYYLDRDLALSLPEEWPPETGRLDHHPGEDLLGMVGLSGGHEAFVLADALARVEAHARVGDPYYLIYTMPFYSDPDGELLAALAARDGLALVESFAGMDVYRGVRHG